MRSRNVSLSFTCLLFAAQISHAAFNIEPALVSFLADKNEKTAFVEIVHTGGDPAAIQVSVHERRLDIDGELIREGLPASSDLLVYPSQIILYPGKRATVQIQYKGKGKITEDKAYVLYTQEVPIDVANEDEDTEISVKMLTNYYTVVALETRKPWKLVFVSSKAIGDNKIEVIAENKGGGRVPIESIYLAVDGKPVADFTGKSNSIMPGQTRRFTFKWPRAVTAKEVKFGN